MGQRSVIHLADANGVSTGEVEIIDTRTLADAQGEALARLASLFMVTDGGMAGSLIDAGLTITIEGSTKLYQIDDASRANIAGKATQAALSLIAGTNINWPPNSVWITADNSTQALSAADMVLLGVTVANYGTALVINARALKDEILALTAVADCDGFDVTQGWPSSSL